MAYDIGPRIGIQGEAEFNRQIKQINNALRECGSEMKALSSEFDENANSQDALVAKNKNLQKELDLQRQKMGLLEDQYEKQVQKLEELRNAYQQAAAESGKTSKEAQKAENAFNKQADEVSKLGVAMNETQNYINQLNNSISIHPWKYEAWFDTKAEAFEYLKAVLGVPEEETLKASAAGISEQKED